MSRNQIRNVVNVGESLTIYEIMGRLEEHYKKYAPALRETQALLKGMAEFEYDDTIWTRVSGDHETTLKMKILHDTELKQKVTRAELAKRYNVHVNSVGMVLKQRRYFKMVGYDDNRNVYKRIG